MGWKESMPQGEEGEDVRTPSDLMSENSKFELILMRRDCKCMRLTARSS
jgi:hypothetical protein